MKNNTIIPFEGTQIRRIEHNGELYFSIVDIVQVLTDSPQPTAYWAKIRKQITKESEVLPFWQKVKLPSKDGKTYPSDCANTEGVLRIIMSIPSPKAEPLKMWLAQTGKQAIEEAENPALSFERMTELYKAKGYTEEWINRRIESIKARKRLTDEWKSRGVTEQKDFSKLTATIAKGTFGLTPSEHKDVKGLDKPSQELRDHMTPLELIFTALGEEASRLVSIRDDAQGFNENHDAAQKGGEEAGTLRKDFERRMQLKVVSTENYLPKDDKSKELPESKDNVDTAS